MKKLFYINLMLSICLAFFISCQSDDHNAFRPGSTHTDDPSEEGGYENLTAENHPRIFMNNEDFKALKLRLKDNSDANLTLLHTEVMALAESKGMDAEPLTYKLDASNKRILNVSQKALLRIFTCAYAYRMTGDKKYLDKAESDINAVCNFSDWNAKRHFLDVGEMATAVSIGYDWLYHDLKEATRTQALTAIKNFAFKPAKEGTWNLNFYEATNNWNQICNGGLICAALATYEDSKTESDEIIKKAIDSNRKAVEAMYAPDGNYPEGYSYWCYGTIYQTLIISALESSIGTDKGLSGISGFSKTAEYMLYMEGLNNKAFNYSDCAQSTVAVLATWWFADKYKNTSLLFNELKKLNKGGYRNSSENRLLPMIMAFASKMNLSEVTPPNNKVWSGKGETPVVIVHTDWTYGDTDKYLGIKGGKASSSHGHMDAGSFVYDAYGVRWSMDLGLQSYTTLENPLAALGGNLWDMGQNSMRWDVFRLNNLNHSTISVNDAKHRVNGVATLTSVINEPTELGGIFDLTAVLSDQVSSAYRTVKIVDDKHLKVVDEIKARHDKNAKIRWCMVTSATPTLENNRIILTFGNKKMYLKTTGDNNITYKTWSTTSQNSYDQPNPNAYMVGFEATLTPNQSSVFTTTLSPE